MEQHIILEVSRIYSNACTLCNNEIKTETSVSDNPKKIEHSLKAVLLFSDLQV